jgi:hypothetical protein
MFFAAEDKRVSLLLMHTLYAVPTYVLDNPMHAVVMLLDIQNWLAEQELFPPRRLHRCCALWWLFEGHSHRALFVRMHSAVQCSHRRACTHPIPRTPQAIHAPTHKLTHQCHHAPPTPSSMHPTLPSHHAHTPHIHHTSSGNVQSSSPHLQ